MSRLHPALAAGLAAAALAGCARSGVETVPAQNQVEAAAAPDVFDSAPPAPPPRAEAIVSAEASADEVAAPALRAPLTVTATSIPRPGAYPREPAFAPPPPVGRDRFASVPQNSFKTVAEEPV